MSPLKLRPQQKQMLLPRPMSLRGKQIRNPERSRRAPVHSRLLHLTHQHQTKPLHRHQKSPLHRHQKRPPR
jgi:hypothetical protein